MLDGRSRLKFSKAVRTGHLVSKRGDKFVRASRRMRVAGIYQQPYCISVLTDSGIHYISIPGGVVRSGPVLTYLA